VGGRNKTLRKIGDALFSNLSQYQLDGVAKENLTVYTVARVNWRGQKKNLATATVRRAG